MKEKLKKLKFENVVYYTLIIFMIALPFCKALSYTLYQLKIVDKFLINQAHILWIVMPVLIIYYMYGLLSEKYELDKFDYFMLALVFLNILSTIFSVDFKKSIFGEDHRYEGVLSLLNYYFIFLNVKNIKNKKHKETLINILLGLGVFQTLYGVLEVYGEFSFIRKFSKPYMAMGLCANPNFLGGYIIMHLMISIVFYFLKKDKKYLIYSIYFYVCLFLAGSTGPFLALILSVIFFIIVYRKKISIKSSLILIAILIIIFVISDQSNRLVQQYIFDEQIESSYSISGDIKNINKNDEDITNGRLFVWKRSLPLVRKYYLLGSGPDTFSDVYPQTGNVVFDKAHNIYIQILITYGVPGFLIYMIMFFLLFLDSFKIKDIYGVAIFFGFIGYSIAAFTGISVIDVSPYYFLISGLLITYIPKRAHKAHN